MFSTSSSVVASSASKVELEVVPVLSPLSSASASFSESRVTSNVDSSCFGVSNVALLSIEQSSVGSSDFDPIGVEEKSSESRNGDLLKVVTSDFSSTTQLAR